MGKIEDGHAEQYNPKEKLIEQLKLVQSHVGVALKTKLLTQAEYQAVSQHISDSLDIISSK
jgi:hypothetical protein